MLSQLPWTSLQNHPAWPTDRVSLHRSSEAQGTADSSPPLMVDIQDNTSALAPGGGEKNDITTSSQPILVCLFFFPSPLAPLSHPSCPHHTTALPRSWISVQGTREPREEMRSGFSPGRRAGSQRGWWVTWNISMAPPPQVCSHCWAWLGAMAVYVPIITPEGCESECGWAQKRSENRPWS